MQRNEQPRLPIQELRQEVFIPAATRIAELHAQGISQFTQIADFQTHVEAARVKSLTNSRGYIHGLLAASRLIDGGKFAERFEPIYQATDDAVTAALLMTAAPEEINKLRIGVANFPISQIAQHLNNIVEALASGVEINKILAREGDIYRWLDLASELTYQYGFYHGGVFALDWLGATQGGSELGGQLMDEFYNIPHPRRDSDEG